MELFKTSRATKIVFGLQVNIHKTNSCRYDVTQKVVYWAKQRPHISVLYVICKVKFKFICLQLN